MNPNEARTAPLPDDALLLAEIVAARADERHQPAARPLTAAAPSEPEADAWRLRAACSDEDPALFFTPGREPAALEVCARCPVQPECFADAILSAESREEAVEGVRGATTGGQRAALLYSGEGRRARSARRLGWSLEDTAAWLRLPVERVAELWAESATIRADA